MNTYAIPLRILCRTIIAVALLLCGPDARAQRRSFDFTRITSEQGLSDNYVLSILQDRRGFMWFGTRDGLNRYDGYQFTIYRHDSKDPGSLSDGSVACIFEDHEGTIWVGTHSGGLNRFNIHSGRFDHYRHQPGNPASIGKGPVRSICEDDKGDLWICASGPESGLSRFNRRTGDFTGFRHDPANPGSLSSNNVTALCRDACGRIWIGTADKGLNRYDPATGTFVNARQNPLFSAESLRAIDDLFASPDGDIWIRSDRRMMILSAGGTSIERTASTSVDLQELSRYYLSAVYPDNSGALWLGTRLNGAYMLEKHSGTLFGITNNQSDPNSLSSNRILCIREDRTGNIWIGTDNGINKLNKRSLDFGHFQHDPFHPEGISARMIRSIAKDASGRLWLGTQDGGLNRIDPGSSRIVHYRHDTANPGSSLTENTVNKIYEDKSGVLWVGANYGIVRIDAATGRLTPYRPDSSSPHALPLGGVWDIMEDADGEFWVAQLGGGLNRMDRRTGIFTQYQHDPKNPGSLGHNYVFCLHQDRRGNFWIGTDGGLNRFDKRTGRFVQYTHRENDPGSLSNDRVWYIHEDRAGTLWIATSGGGLNRFDPRTGIFRAYTEENGLANNTVCGILEDRHGRLWISTNKGISRFDPESAAFRNYTVQDGLYVSEFQFKSCYQDGDGFMYFGGTNGMVRFHPDSLQENRLPPPLVLTSFRVFDTDYPLDSAIMLKQGIRLAHDSGFFSIGFSALDFTNTLGNRYRYRLEGVDAGWRETDGRHPRADYTNIAPGTYTFRVMAANSDGFWNEQETSITIIVEPAFWQTWWFKLSAGIIAAGILFWLVYLWNGSVRRKGELERNMVEYKLQALRAQMNPHFIFNSLNSILHFILHHDSESAHRYLSKFSRLIRSTLEHSKSERIALADEIEALRFYLDLETLRFEEKLSYEIRIAPDIDIHTIAIPPMLIQPHAENAIKHGIAPRRSPGNLLIDIRRTGDDIICSVTDDGIGRVRTAPANAPGADGHRSRGMELTRERLDVLGTLGGGRYRFNVIDLTDESGAPAGTRVEICIPATKI